MILQELPTGIVTFLFTDIEGSTRLWEQAPDESMQSLALHDEIIESEVVDNRGVIVRPRGEGDSRFAVFEQARDAVAAAAAIQKQFYAEHWSTPQPLKVRMAMHTGEADLRMGDYYGSAVNRCARLRSIANGGQTLLSGATWALVQDGLPPGATAQDEGEHRLKDLTRPEHVYQLIIPELPHDFPPLRSLSIIPNNLPVQLTEFIGRQDDLVVIRRSFQETRLLTLVGPGGIGKSRLAIEVAAELADQFRYGVFFITLASVQSADDVIQAIAEGIGLSLASGDAPREQLLNYLRNKQQLLVVDNFEQAIGAADLVDEILHDASYVKVMATSRIRLNLSSETVYGLLGLKSDGWRTAQSALNNESAQLFISTAHRTRPGFELKAGDLPPLKKIINLVEGSPLGILLAASWVNMLPLQEIADEIARDFDFLETNIRDMPERQHSVRAVFETTWRLLTSMERELFADLSIFRGGFTRQAAHKVAGASLRQLTNLAYQSLLSANPESGRYSVHELLRQYGEATLQEDQERYAAIQEAHALHYAEFMDQAWYRLDHDEQPQALLEIEADIENVRLAWRYLTSQGDPQEALRMVRALWFIHDIRGWHVAGAEIFQAAALEASSRPASKSLKVLMAISANEQGFFNAVQGAVDDALILGEQATADLRSLDAPDDLAFAINQFCPALYFTAQLSRMKEVCFEAINISDDRMNLLGAHSWICNAALMEGNIDEAKKHLYIFEDLLGQTKNYWWIYYKYMLRYLAARDPSDITKSRQILEEALANVRIINYRRGILYSLANLASLSMALNDHAAAQRYILESLQVSEELGSIGQKLSSLVDLAFALAADGRREEALEMAATAYAHPLSYQNSPFNMEPIRSRAEEVQASQVGGVDPDEATAAWNRGLSADFEGVVTNLIESRSRE